MSSFPLNYKIRETKGALTGGVGWLFTIYFLHCDNLLRCYPSNELLKEETGIAHDKTLQKYRDKLIAMKALVLVPHEKRLSGKEKALPPRKFVYQVTGIMELPDGTIIPTVHINSPDVLATHVSILESLGFDTKLIWRAFSEVSKPVRNEVLKPVTNEVSKPVKSEDEVVQESSTEEVKETTSTPAAVVLISDEKTVQVEVSKDPLFDWVSLNCFNIDPYNPDHKPELKTNKGRIAKIAVYLREKQATVPQLDAFKIHYKKTMPPDYAMPRDVGKFSNQFKNFLELQSKPKQAAPLRFTQMKAPANLDMLDTNPRKASGS